MVIQRRVAVRYAESLTTAGRGLGRSGTNLTSGEDNDLAYTACDLGLGMGLFGRLRLTHLIPKERLTEEYMLRLAEAMSYSGYLLTAMRPKLEEDLGVPRPWRRLLQSILAGKFSWKLARAKYRGIRRAKQALRER